MSSTISTFIRAGGRDGRRPFLGKPAFPTELSKGPAHRALQESKRVGQPRGPEARGSFQAFKVAPNTVSYKLSFDPLSRYLFETTRGRSELARHSQRLDD